MEVLEREKESALLGASIWYRHVARDESSDIRRRVFSDTWRRSSGSHTVFENDCDVSWCRQRMLWEFQARAIVGIANEWEGVNLFTLLYIVIHLMNIEKILCENEIL